MNLDNDVTIMQMINKCNIVGAPSNKIIDLTYGADNSAYKAPGNGYYALTYSATRGTYLCLENSNNHLRTELHNNNHYMSIFIPAKKDDVVYLFTDCSGSVIYFKFIYCE